MHLVRYRNRTSGITGIAASTDVAQPLYAGGQAVSGFADLLQLPLPDIHDVVSSSSRRPNSLGQGEIELLSPCDGRMEVWAAGVTYLRSRDARMEESTEQSVYDRVYDAERPELFFKSVPWRVVTDGAPIAIRSDSPLNVPEPELAVIVNAHAEVVGYTVCDDVSSRSIEGDNPLYLPQAKLYEGSCALAAPVRPAWEIADPYDLSIRAHIRRGSDIVWEADTTTASLHRSISDLIDWLFAQQRFPEGVVLSTGTALVPPMDVTLLPGDEVGIVIEEVGQLSNPVGVGVDRNRHVPTVSVPT